MRGSHCLKSWAKTQAIVAKSSAEAELYGVVRGATEALGMTSLLQDMGIQVKMQMRLDEAAAKGIVERKGLTKVRHLDVNVLWLQETCARRDIPLHKIPGEDNPADLMTKHIGAAKIDKHVKKMNMEYKSGRSGKAAQLHSLETREARELWESIMKTGHELRGGDRWIMKGECGVWCRAHTTPRLAKFTPYKVA